MGLTEIALGELVQLVDERGKSGQTEHRIPE